MRNQAQSVTREWKVISDNLLAVVYEREWTRYTEDGDVPTRMYSFRIFRLKKQQADTRQYDRIFVHMIDELRDLLWRVEERVDELRRDWYERRLAERGEAPPPDDNPIPAPAALAEPAPEPEPDSREDAPETSSE